MRTMQLDVPVEAITEFAELVEENEIKNNITGVNEDGEIQIEIEYEREQRNGVMVILEVIGNYTGDEEESGERGTGIQIMSGFGSGLNERMGEARCCPPVRAYAGTFLFKQLSLT
jgi:hypothetical protein